MSNRAKSAGVSISSTPRSRDTVTTVFRARAVQRRGHPEGPRNSAKWVDNTGNSHCEMCFNANPRASTGYTGAAKYSSSDGKGTDITGNAVSGYDHARAMTMPERVGSSEASSHVDNSRAVFYLMKS